MFALGRAAWAWVKTLLRKGVQVNSRDSGGRTALHYPCKSEDKDMQRVVDVLLDAGAEVNAHAEDGQTPLHVAVQRISFQTKRENNAAGGENEETPLTISSTSESSKDRSSQHLVDHSQDEEKILAVSSQDHTALPLACMSSSLTDQAMESDCLLLRAGAKVGVKNNNGETALHMDASYSRADIVHILLNNEEDVNATDRSGDTPLHKASGKGRTEIVRSLLSKGAKVGVENNNGETALHKATSCSSEDIVDILLNSGEDVNAMDEYGNTPLHVACESGRTETVRLLYRKGAKVGVKDHAGWTALHMAARHSKADIVDILLNNGEDVNATDEYGDTPLHVACESGQTETVRLLYRMGAKVGVKNRKGQTPLHTAAFFAAGDIVDVLVDHGEYVSAEDKYGNTPLHYLCEKAELDSLSRKAHSQSHLSKAVIVFNINLLIIRGAKINEQNIHGKKLHERIKARRDYQMKDVETTLITQAIRLKTLGLQDKLYISWIIGLDFNDNVQLQCYRELESMKSNMVVNDISLYQVLSHISQSFFVSTEDLQHIDEFVSSPDLLTRFPLYGDTLRITFQRAKLLTLAVQSFYSERRKQMMKKLPFEVAEQLVNFLSNKDLRMFIESE